MRTAKTPENTRQSARFVDKVDTTGHLPFELVYQYQGTTRTSLSSLSPNPVKMKKFTQIIILIVQLIAMSTVCSRSVMTVKLSTKHE